MAGLLERLQTCLATRYRVERELGRGGMATVYLAADRKHQRRVAIKVLDPEVAAAVAAVAVGVGEVWRRARRRRQRWRG